MIIRCYHAGYCINKARQVLTCVRRPSRSPTRPSALKLLCSSVRWTWRPVQGCAEHKLHGHSTAGHRGLAVSLQTCSSAVSRHYMHMRFRMAAWPLPGAHVTASTQTAVQPGECGELDKMCACLDLRSSDDDRGARAFTSVAVLQCVACSFWRVVSKGVVCKGIEAKALRQIPGYDPGKTGSR
jgi:hypothetical protein